MKNNKGGLMANNTLKSTDEMTPEELLAEQERLAAEVAPASAVLPPPPAAVPEVKPPVKTERDILNDYLMSRAQNQREELDLRSSTAQNNANLGYLGAMNTAAQAALGRKADNAPFQQMQKDSQVDLDSYLKNKMAGEKETMDVALAKAKLDAPKPADKGTWLKDKIVRNGKTYVIATNPVTKEERILGEAPKDAPQGVGKFHAMGEITDGPYRGYNATLNDLDGGYYVNVGGKNVRVDGYKVKPVGEERRMNEQQLKVLKDTQDNFQKLPLVKESNQALNVADKTDLAINAVMKADPSQRQRQMGILTTEFARAIQSGVLTNQDIQRSTAEHPGLEGMTVDKLTKLSGDVPDEQLRALQTVLANAKQRAMYTYSKSLQEFRRSRKSIFDVIGQDVYQAYFMNPITAETVWSEQQIADYDKSIKGIKTGSPTVSSPKVDPTANPAPASVAPPPAPKQTSAPTAFPKIVYKTDPQTGAKLQAEVKNEDDLAKAKLKGFN
jgi:hypothetical protein